ncbi:fla cluster protein FlaF [Haloferax mediterranei ATCC 33500]|uniref:Fla cluster protein FlaF n=1 Tax=Haloferax mediterranei (strain ATCC 33500 / DSM 1411 / JCM 8866 / NBRC 14739 / NCIMB 2177 / R-4) TaxID=523841 RepID=I3R3X7_HALMT|nr:fla cluster protein flaF [Haloferax mediterranei]AFK18937.1 fla cluster protein flaF [Haloferax mediterranei ATCC 33500]AHZ21701.1 fla cluster protein FlaF [Haloferax mediterranei ATCC 33500]EMA03205.1 fla cluster protein flaF [Haloferax mediterranei ATCC 33500]MDX5989028.1 fla cluster protein FlaF [Haloferax mediterranei ATCC 33500]QCQ75422.1 fla cluster protein FlaF [Haloferax mediterranei ATCC 33500]
MGFGVSGSTAIIFLGVLIATGTLYTATSNATENVLEAQDADAEQALERTNTEISIAEASYDSGTSNLTVNVTNNGSETLSVNETTLLADNAHVKVPNENSTVEGDTTTDLWFAGENLTIEVGFDSAPSRVKVVTGTGVAATEEVS